jgi:hypothetical protein
MVVVTVKQKMGGKDPIIEQTRVDQIALRLEKLQIPHSISRCDMQYLYPLCDPIL